MWWLSSIVILFPLLYGTIIILLSEGIRALRCGKVQSSELPVPVTMVIPFRDEEKNLPALVRELLGQNYPPEMLNFILVNDHSKDRSAELLEELTGTASRFRCLELGAGQEGKKEAIRLGVRNAESDWIIQVDADCRLGPGFVHSHMAFRERNPCDLVAGMVTTGEGTGGFLEVFERLDLLGMLGAGAGSFRWGRPVMCSGANLAYSQRFFLEAGNHDPGAGIASGDDMFLMIAARKMGRKLRFHCDRGSMVVTPPAGSWLSLLDQRIRWGSKTIHYRTADIEGLALLVAITNLTVLASPMLILLIPASWPWLLAAIAVKSGADFLLLFRISGSTGQRRDLLWFLPVSMAYYPFHLLILAGSLLRKPRWKGRRL